MKYYTRKKLTYEYINSINTLWGGNKLPLLHFLERRIYGRTTSGTGTRRSTAAYPCRYSWI